MPEKDDYIVMYSAEDNACDYKLRFCGFDIGGTYLVVLTKGIYANNTSLSACKSHAVVFMVFPNFSKSASHFVALFCKFYKNFCKFYETVL